MGQAIIAWPNFVCDFLYLLGTGWESPLLNLATTIPSHTESKEGSSHLFDRKVRTSRKSKDKRSQRLGRFLPSLFALCLAPNSRRMRLSIDSNLIGSSQNLALVDIGSGPGGKILKPEDYVLDTLRLDELGLELIHLVARLA